MKERISWIVIPVGLLMLVAGASVAADLDGKTVFLDQKCNMCHAVPSAEIESKVKIEKMKGPDITGMSSVGAEELGKYLRKQSQIDGKDHKKEFKGTDEELAAMVAWFGTLK